MGRPVVEGLLGLRGEVSVEAAGRIGHGHRAHAVAQHVKPLRQSGILCIHVLQDVVERTPHAVAGSLAGHDDDVVRQQDLEELDVPLTDGTAVMRQQDFGGEHRVVLGDRAAALDLEMSCGATQDRVVVPGLGDHTHQRVAGGAQLAVERPEVQRVLAGLGQLFDVVPGLIDQPGVVAVEVHRGHFWTRDDAAMDDVVRAHHGVADLAVQDRDLRVLLDGAAIGRLPETREEVLPGEVRVERAVDAGDETRVAVHELRQAYVVVDGAASAASTHVQRTVRVAEVALQVDAEQRDAHGIARGEGDALAVAIGEGLLGDQGQVGVVAPDFGILRVEEGRDRHVCISGSGCSFLELQGADQAGAWSGLCDLMYKERSVTLAK